MIDQDKMRALAKAAPSGGWETWTSNSWRRVYAGGNPAITPCVHPHDNHPDLTFAPGVREWIEAATPDAIVALLDKLDAMDRENNRLRAELEAAAADKREEPSLTNPLTPYGLLVRALRIVAGITLMDMATALLTTPAKLSAMEFGRTPVTPEFAFDVSAYFDALGVPHTASALRAAIEAPPLFKRQEES